MMTPVFTLLLLLALQTSGTRFGVLVQPPDNLAGNSPGLFRVAVATALGVSCLRDAVALDNPKSGGMSGQGFAILLNINLTAAKAGNQTRFATDMTDYEAKLEAQVTRYGAAPLVAVIDNEACNPVFYYQEATPDTYLRQLRVAVKVLHSHGIKVADAGVTMPPLLYLYAQSLPSDSSRAVIHRNGLGGTQLQQTAAWVDRFLDSIRTIPTDYINFHWYHAAGDDINDLRGCIDYLQQRTGKTVLTNEIGQYDDAAFTTRLLVAVAREKKLAYAVFYSDKDMQGRSHPYHCPSGGLTRTGRALAAAIQ